MELCSGWSRGDAWALLFLDQTEARRAKKKIWETASPPPRPLSQCLDDWVHPLIRHWSDWLKICFAQWEALIISFFPQATACTRTLRSNSTLACFTENRKWHTRNPSAVIRLGPSRINIRRSLDAHSILQGNKHHTKKVQMHSRDSYKDIM